MKNVQTQAKKEWKKLKSQAEFLNKRKTCRKMPESENKTEKK